MKYIYLLFSVLTVVSCMNDKQPEVKVIEVSATKTTEIIKSDVTFGVRGNCGMCKSTIESATMSIEGVDTASWNLIFLLSWFKKPKNIIYFCTAAQVQAGRNKHAKT